MTKYFLRKNFFIFLNIGYAVILDHFITIVPEASKFPVLSAAHCAAAFKNTFLTPPTALRAIPVSIPAVAPTGPLATTA